MIGQRKLLKWTVPGVAHALTFWDSIVLLLTIVEAYGNLFSKTFAVPVVGHWAVVGFGEDLFAVGVLAGIIAFSIIRLRSNPHRAGRASRFAGSHTGAAWLVLLGIFLVIATLLLYRGAQINTGDFPYPHGAFASQLVGHGLARAGLAANRALETAFLLVQTACARSNRCAATGRCWTSKKPTRTPTCSAWALSKTSAGRACWTWPPAPNADGASRSARHGLPASRCHPSRSSWSLRDHALGKGPYLLAASDETREQLPEAVKAEAARPLVGGAEVNGVIDPDALWACTNCGACVEECPVDIEHIDHISGLRRHQVLIESAFPVEAAGMLKNLENKGDPWGMGQAKRLEWAAELDFEVPVVDGTLGADVD